jgi:hypothetical protein
VIVALEAPVNDNKFTRTYVTGFPSTWNIVGLVVHDWVPDKSTQLLLSSDPSSRTVQADGEPDTTT